LTSVDPNRSRVIEQFMIIIDGKNKNKLKNPEPPDSGGDFTEVSPRKIIDFELGRKTLGKAGSERAQTSARLAECSRSPGRLHDDWLELLLTIGMFFALFLGLYAGLVEVWRF
jgi:hypothetical protein